MGDNNGTPPEGGQETPPEGGDRTFTQADVEQLIKERLERDRRTRDEKYADYDELKKSAAELKKLKDADLSAQEKKDKRIAELEKAQADWDAKVKAQEAATNTKLIQAEVRVQAAQMGFTNPDDAYRLADLSEVEVGEDGGIKGVKKALEALKKDKPYLLAKAGGPGSPANDPKKKKAETNWVDEARERYGIANHDRKAGG